jgi:hypothetical protein
MMNTKDAPRSLIDPPSPFAPASEWDAFVTELQAMDPTDPAVIAAKKLAAQMLGK